MAEFDRPRKSMWGFKTSPNSEVMAIERWLGLTFKERPSKVDLTRRNLLVYCMREGKVTWTNIKEGVGDDLGGFYDPNYRAIFLITGFHR